MESVTVNLSTVGKFRSSEIVADLRNVAEILFHPMRCVGFWDMSTSGHICPQIQRNEECNHVGVSAVDIYRDLVEREMGCVIEVHFSHADVFIYLG